MKVFRYILILFLLCLCWSSSSYAESAPYYYKHTSIESIAQKVGFKIYENITSSIDKTLPIAYCTFVELDDFERTSSFGKILGDSVGEYLSRRGYKIIETQLRGNSVEIRKSSGQFGLTREMGQLRRNLNIQALVVGTYDLVNSSSVYISAKLISTVDNSILSSCSFHFGIHSSLRDLLRADGTRKASGRASGGNQKGLQGQAARGETVLTLQSTQDVKTIQKRFKELGLYEYKIDGIWGKRSKKALEYFKKAHGLDNYSQWDLETQKKVFAQSG